MDTKTIISDLALKAKNSVVSYSELVPFVADLNLDLLKEVEVGLNNKGLTLGLPEFRTPDDIIDSEQLRELLGLPDFDEMTDTQKATLSNQKMNRFNRILLAAYQLAKTEEDKIVIQNYLVSHNQNLISSAAKAYFQRSDYTDICQNGDIGLIKAVRNYNFDENIPFGVYARTWVVKEINIWLKAHTTAYTLDAGQKDINPVLTKIVAEIYQEDSTAEITYEEVKKRFAERTNRRTLTLENFKVFMSLRSNPFTSLDDSFGSDSDSGDKNLSIAEVTPSGINLESSKETSISSVEHFKRLNRAMNAIEEADTKAPADGATLVATWLKYDWITQDPKVARVLEPKTAQDVGALIGLNLAENEMYEASLTPGASQSIEEDSIPEPFSAEELLNVHYMITGCHGETRTRLDSKGNPVRKKTEEIHGSIADFTEYVQKLSYRKKLALIKGLTDNYPGDILIIAEYFGVSTSGYVAAPPRSAAGEDRLVSDEDIGVSLGDMSRAAVGHKVKKASQQIQNAIKTLPEFRQREDL